MQGEDNRGAINKAQAVGVVALAVLVILVAAYLSTLQSIPNGSEARTMIDVGETQAVLNTWGTLHSTGYPHYVITGNLGTAILRWVGVSGVTAAALVSLGWTLLALLLLALLVYDLTRMPLLALVTVLLYGLTSFVWLHAVIAEIYAFGLLIQTLLLWLALSPRPIRHRIAWLAFVGGIGTAHHRGIGLMAPALLVAVWPELWSQLREKPSRVLFWLILGLLGWLPYLYLPLRADATWAYGDLHSLGGLLDQMRGVEADYLLQWPDDEAALTANVANVHNILQDNLGTIGFWVGLAALAFLVFLPRWRRAGLVLALLAGVAYGFSTLFYYDILATLILSISLALGLALSFVVSVGLRLSANHKLRWALLFFFALMGGGWLHHNNHKTIYSLTHDRTGENIIAQLAQAPPGSTVSLQWGPRYFAVGVAQDVQGRLSHIQRVDDRADFAQIVQNSRLLTPEYARYAQPPSWWEARIGSPVIVRAGAPAWVEISTERDFWPESRPLPTSEEEVPLLLAEHELLCSEGQYIALRVDWVAIAAPQRDLSVMVHLLNESAQRLATADQFAPVYGWRPTSTLASRELLRDYYPLPPTPGATAVRIGLYEQLPDTSFVNYNVQIIPLECP